MRHTLLPALAIMALTWLSTLTAYYADYPLGMTHPVEAAYRAAVDDARAGSDQVESLYRGAIVRFSGHLESQVGLQFSL